MTYYNTSSRVNARAAWNRAGRSLTIRCDSRTSHQNQNCVTPEDREAFALSFGITRRQSVNNDGIAPEHGVQLELNTQF